VLTARPHIRIGRATERVLCNGRGSDTFWRI
jgi:hypothetical protein